MVEIFFIKQKKFPQRPKFFMSMQKLDLKINLADSIAAKVEKYAAMVEMKTGNQPTPQQIMAKIKEELEL